MEKESWIKNPGERILEKESWRKNLGERILENESWRKNPGEKSPVEKTGQHCLEECNMNRERGNSNYREYTFMMFGAVKLRSDPTKSGLICPPIFGGRRSPYGEHWLK